MNHSANLRTKARPRSVWLIGRSTTLTYLQGAPDRRIPAGTRAVFDGTEGSFPRVELAAAVGAGRCAAVIANEGCPGARCKLITTGATATNRRVVRETTLLKQFRIGFPERNFFGFVACGTERYEVTQDIGVSVVAEQAERPDVVDRQSWSSHAASLARIAVTLTRYLALPDPILSAIADMATEPSGVVFATPSRRRTPLSKASATTEVARLDRTRHFLNRVSAGCAHHLNPVRPNALAMDTLPCSVTSKPTNRVLRHRSVIGLSLNRSPALNTSNSNHAQLYHVWTIDNGGHFA